MHGCPRRTNRQQRAFSRWLAVVDMACCVWETRGERLQTDTGGSACALLLQSSQQAEDLQASKAEAAGLHAQLASAQVCVLGWG